MQGAVYLGDRRLELREFPTPVPGPGEVVVQVKASGLCGSDLHYYRAPAGPNHGRFIAGHEPAGVIHAVGEGVGERMGRVGDRVMIHHYLGCGTCRQCRAGWSEMCLGQMLVLGSEGHGGHAPYMVVPAAAAMPLVDALSFEAGAAIACGTGTAWGALQRLGDVGGATVAVFGQGPVGLSVTMLAVARGARVIGIDPVRARRDRALDFGATAVIDPADGRVPEAIRHFAGPDGANLAVETSGSSVAATAALDGLERWGRACFVGVGAEIRIGVSEYLRRQHTVMVSWSMSAVGMSECADFVVANGLPVDALFSDRWRLDEVVQAYRHFDRQDAGKGAIVF